MEHDRHSLWQLNKYTWMSLAFVLVYLVVAREQHLIDVPIWVAWALFGVAIADAIGRTTLAYRRGGTLDGFWAMLFNSLEILLITAAVGVTGGIRSDLWLLYFVIMLFESLYAEPRTKDLLYLYIASMYLLATLLSQSLLPQVVDPPPIFIRVLITRLFFLYMITSLARRISAETRKRDYELMRLREQMATGEERARIAREIHDGLGHALVSSILRLELCARLIREAPEEAESLLKEEVPALRAAWNEGRDLAFHLRPWEAEAASTSLPDMLRRHIGRFAERTGMPIDLKVEGESWQLRPDLTLGITRIVQEGLTNAIRHAGASHLEVALKHTPGTAVICTITDDGKGFSVEAAQEGVGLYAMRERAENLGGTCQVQSAPGQGTTITITIPNYFPSGRALMRKEQV